MKTSKSDHWIFRPVAMVLAAAFALAGVSCTTSYDAYGRPQQAVDPGVAVAGAAAAGVLGYAIASDRKDRRVDRRHHHHYYPTPRHYRRGYYR